MDSIKKTVLLPYALTWASDNFHARCVTRATKPGRGDAGWTVGRFESVEAAEAFMVAHPEAALPCWKRGVAKAFK